MDIDKLIYDLAIKAGFSKKLALLIVAQARFESADYSNNQTKLNNNLFGFKFVGQPLAKQGNKSPEGNYYAKYASLQDSVKDYIERYFNITRAGVTPQDLKNSVDSTDFAKKLKQRGYFGASAAQYAAGLESKLQKINIKAVAIGGGVLALIAVVIYLVIKKK